jgi:hypothetical protein
MLGRRLSDILMHFRRVKVETGLDEHIGKNSVQHPEILRLNLYIMMHQLAHTAGILNSGARFRKKKWHACTERSKMDVDVDTKSHA